MTRTPARTSPSRAGPIGIAGWKVARIRAGLAATVSAKSDWSARSSRATCVRHAPAKSSSSGVRRRFRRGRGGVRDSRRRRRAAPTRPTGRPTKPQRWSVRSAHRRRDRRQPARDDQRARPGRGGLGLRQQLGRDRRRRGAATGARSTRSWRSSLHRRQAWSVAAPAFVEPRRARCARVRAGEVLRVADARCGRAT